jgi:hypothetical protein
MRSSDINKLRKLRHAQAILLGVTITDQGAFGSLPWLYEAPDGSLHGHWKTRHEAVDSALRWLGVELNKSNYRHGNKTAAAARRRCRLIFPRRPDDGKHSKN